MAKIRMLNKRTGRAHLMSEKLAAALVGRTDRFHYADEVNEPQKADPAPTPVKRGRGRPRKNPLPVSHETPAKQVPQEDTPRYNRRDLRPEE